MNANDRELGRLPRPLLVDHRRGAPARHHAPDPSASSRFPGILEAIQASAAKWLSTAAAPLATRRIVAAVIVLCALSLSTAVTQSAQAAGAYDNAAIADKALSYWNGVNGPGGAWGGNACTDARKPGDSGGQCRAFVNCVVWMVSGGTQNLGGSDYFQPFLTAGGTEITDVNSLAKGDILQIGQGVHTTIIVSRNADGSFMVVDSNHDRQERVWYYARSIALSSSARAFRMGRLGPGGAGAGTVAFQANTGNLWTVGPGGNGDWHLGMQQVTSPSISPSGEVAFQANTGHLWVVGPGGGGDTGLGMMAGTSPSISSTGEVAFQANTGNLWTIGPGGHGDWGLGMKSRTSPSISPSGAVAFQANTGNLWVVGPGGGGDTGLGMMSLTSPSISSTGEVAFQANTGNLWTIGPGGHGDWGLGMTTVSSPSIARSGEVAFQANTGHLWVVGPGGGGDTGLGMKPNTTPSISSNGEVAFQANTGNLWTIGPGGHGDWGLGMQPGTSPGI